MFTIMVLEDEDKVCQLLSDALKKEGYDIISEPRTGGSIKIVKRGDLCGEHALSEGVVDITSIVMRHRNGQIYKSLLEEVEKPLVETVLKKTEGNKLKAARMLGINRNTLDAKIKKLGIDVLQFKE